MMRMGVVGASVLFPLFWRPGMAAAFVCASLPTGVGPGHAGDLCSTEYRHLRPKHETGPPRIDKQSPVVGGRDKQDMCLTRRRMEGRKGAANAKTACVA